MKSLIISLCAVSLLSACSVNVNKPKPQPASQSQASTSECAGTFIKAINLASGYTLVVEEGRLEPRSIGSITVKLYRDLYVGDFVGSVSFVRDGTILKAVLIDNGSDKQKLSITTVTAGSGNYQNSRLICIAGDDISLC
ncbi:PliI family lysozyme inhibitor of I-type lysozyme [Shewanella sp. 125m-7]